MSTSREQKTLREAADMILREHSELMFHHGHDGAAHCQCELAERYREADELFWNARKRKKREDLVGEC